MLAVPMQEFRFLCLWLWTFFLLGCDAMHSDRYLRNLQRSVLPPALG